jgi:hypothetical protein
MANKNLLTHGAESKSVEQLYFSPLSFLPNTNLPVSSIYAFLAKVDAWPDIENPPNPTQDQLTIKKIFKNIFVIKKITNNSISAVIERIDWETNTIFDEYRDDIDMLAKDNNGFLIKKFYVKNKYDQVFKCLSNNNGNPSTVEPYFEPGSYSTLNIFQGSDDYKWKYMYTIDSGKKVTFMDSSWMPVDIDSGNTTPISATTAGSGDIEVINIINGGSGYDSLNAAISIVVTGDGIGATAIADVANGSISDIIVTNPGTGYTFANVTITSTLGSNAVVYGPISPMGGHGFDSLNELGCSHIMLSCELDGDENGYIPTDIDYFQLGLLINPVAQSNLSRAQANIYKATTDCVVAPGFGLYTNDETVWQGSSFETATFKATVLSFDAASNILKTINTTGTVTENASIFGQSSLTTRTLLSCSFPDLIPFSGVISYIENRSGIQRSFDGIEQIKVVLGY